MIKVTAQLSDKKVKSTNVQFLIDIATYVELAKCIIENNPFQRNRVSKRGSVYSLLREDIVSGCIMPPIVLASTLSSDKEFGVVADSILAEILKSYGDIKILDGLQRTFTLIEAYTSHKDYFDSLEEPYVLRVELYLSISETGILYRMLTLNTGQTPMTLRHQLEILYSKYLDGGIDGLRVIRDVDGAVVSEISDYKFADLIDGYTSFLEMNELPIDRFDILSAVKTTEFVAKADAERIDFKRFAITYSKVASKFNSVFPGWVYPDSAAVPDDYAIKTNPYGKNVCSMLNRSQTITGFGAAVAELIDLGVLDSIQAVDGLLDSLIFNEDDLLVINKYLDDVKERSKKIGTGQRIFFKYFFKGLFDRESPTYMKVRDSLDRALKRAIAEV